MMDKQCLPLVLVIATCTVYSTSVADAETDVPVCEKFWKPGKRHCYQLQEFVKHILQYDAQKECQNKEAFLATITDKNDTNVIIELTNLLQRQESLHLWIGLNDKMKKGIFVWEDASPLNYTSWAKGEPRNQPNSACVTMNKAGEWHYRDCGYKSVMVAVCAKPRKDVTVATCKVTAGEITFQKKKEGEWMKTICGTGSLGVYGDERVQCLSDGNFSGIPLLCSKTKLATCPDKWASGLTHCYRIFKDFKSYHNARIECGRMNAFLATFSDKKEAHFARNHFRKTFENIWWRREVWIGLLQNGINVELAGGNMSSINHTSRIADTNDKIESEKQCMLMNASGIWKNSNCEEGKMFMCGKPGKEQGGTCHAENFTPRNACLKTKKTIKEGEWANYTCISTFVAVEGNASRQCLSDGKLSRKPLKCLKRADCNATEFTPPNAILKTKKTILTGGQSAKYACKSGYVAVEGDTRLKCLPYGQFSGRPLKCLKSVNCKSYWSPGSKKCYRILKNSRSYEDARTFCGEKKASIVSVSGKWENYILTNYLSRKRIDSKYTLDSAWIGLRYNTSTSTFVWEDGSPLNFTSWAEGQPETKQQKYCVILDRNGQWTSVECDHYYFHICAKKPQQNP